jgi:L-ascorbate 6-phosphate lactonase
MFEIPTANKLNVYFLGQAGFLFVDKNGVRTAVDPYLSDYCNKIGFKRLMPFMFPAKSLELDILLISHFHEDHFDPDSVPAMMENGKTKMIAAADCEAECDKAKINKERAVFLKAGETAECAGVKIQATECDHGDAAPLAVGFLLKISGLTVYIAGDTCYRPDIFEKIKRSEPDLAIFPINGAFGNLNEDEAARAMDIIKPKTAIPCHFWNFAEHGGNPMVFKEKMKNVDVPYVIMRMGECLSL